MAGLRFPKPSPTLDKRQKQRDRDAAYRKASTEVRKRDGGRCRHCGAMGTEVHHIVARSLGRDDSPSNLVLLCHDCHELTQHHYLRIVGSDANKRLSFERSEYMR